MKKDWLGYVLLPTALVGIFGGMSMGTDGKHLGWLGMVVGLALAFAAYRMMTPGRAETSATADTAGDQQNQP